MPLVEVKLFARARDLAGSDTVSLDLPDGCSVCEFRTRLVAKYPTLRPLADKLLVAAGSKYVREGETIPQGAALACFPPVSGG